MKNKKVNSIGKSIFGCGALFFCIGLMSSGMSPLRTLDSFHDLTISMSNSPVLGVVIGTVFTMIVQSSSATIGILQGIFAEGAISLKAALPVILDRKSTRLNSSHVAISYAVFCLKKKKKNDKNTVI